jgi:pimeloyl-ACP methyl ester carboxylesterase
VTTADDDDARDDSAVLLVHGWGGSFTATWERTGFTALLADAGREVIGVDLLGHGSAPKPHDPAAYADLTERITQALPDDGAVDAIGFSLGALTLLRTAIDRPDRFRRLVLAGIGRNVFERDDTGTQRILAALDRVMGNTGDDDDEGDGDDDRGLDNVSRLFAQYAEQPGNDIQALAAVLRRPPGPPFTPERLSLVTCPTLVVVGDQDFVHPADALVDALPDARVEVLRHVDHFATPESFGFIDAALEFIDAVPV